MSYIPYTKRQLIQRVQIHLANDLPGADSSLLDEQVLLYIDQAVAFTLVGQEYQGAKVEGSLVMPEAYVSVYNLTNLQQDLNTGYWYVTLPQPPVSLPLGYSITDAYFAQTAYGKSQPIFPIKNKRVSYREFMPLPTGTRYWVEGETMWLAASNNQPLLNQNLYVKMAKTRTQDIDESLLLPDDAIEQIFNNVVMKCKDRLGIPQDVVEDNLPAGNKGS